MTHEQRRVHHDMRAYCLAKCDQALDLNRPHQFRVWARLFHRHTVALGG